MNSFSLTGSSTSISGYSSSSCNTLGTSLTLQPNTIYYHNNNTQMKQVKAVLLKVVKDPETNAIIDSTVEQEFWVKQKPDVSFELAAMVELGRVIDPETEVIKEVYSLYL
jgi:hypothetical protein